MGADCSELRNRNGHDQCDDRLQCFLQHRQVELDHDQRSERERFASGHDLQLCIAIGEWQCAGCRWQWPGWRDRACGLFMDLVDQRSELADDFLFWNWRKWRNTSSTPRSGSLTIAGLGYMVSQDGAPCSYTLGTKSTNVSSSGLNGATFPFSTAASGCSPNAVSYSNWITASTSFSGSSGMVTFNVTPNFSGMNRQGTIQLGDQGFTVTENAAACAYSLNSYGEVFSHLGGADQVLGSPNALGCTPVTGTDQPSFITLAPLVGPVNNIFTQPFQVTPFNAALPVLRFGTITFGGQIFAIKQTSW